MTNLQLNAATPTSTSFTTFSKEKSKKTTAQLTIKNTGTCPTEIYLWLSTGDVLKTTIVPGGSWTTTAEWGSMWRAINTNPNWGNLLYDQHYTVGSNISTATWTVTPTYCITNNCAFTATAGSGSIIFTGLTAGSNIQLFTCSWSPITVPAYTGSTLTLPVSAGCYIIKYWSLTCGEKRVDLTVTGSTNPCDNDVTAPIISGCPANINLSTSATCANATWTAPTATDNCGTPTVAQTAGPASGSCIPVGTTTITYTATDAKGNKSTCSFTITVTKNTPPNCATVCRDVTDSKFNLNQFGSFIINLINEPVTDQYWGFEAGAKFCDNADGTASLIGTIYQYGYDAVNGVSKSNRKFDINVNFTNRAFTPPTGSPYLDPALTVNTSNWYYYSMTSGTFTGKGALLGGVLNITQQGPAFQVGTGADQQPGDENLNGASGWFKWTIASQPSNGLTFKAYTNPCAGNGFPTGCTQGDINIKLSGTPLAPCTPVNTNPCTTDVTAPVFKGCPANISLTNNNVNKCEIATWTAPTATDNCGTPIVVQTSGLSSGTCFPIGTTTITYTATDAKGNTATCSFTVTVVNANTTGNLCTDANPVTSTSSSIIINGITSGCAYIQIFNASWITVFNQQTTGTTVTVPNLAAGAYKVKVSVLGAGCTWPMLCEKTFDVNVNGTTGNPCDNDATAPVFAGCPTNISKSNNNINKCEIITWTAPTATDNCGTPTVVQTAGLASGSCFPIGTTTITYTATDAKGNKSTCSFTITVTSAPCINVPTVTFGNLTKTLDATSVGTNACNTAAFSQSLWLPGLLPAGYNSAIGSNGELWNLTNGVWKEYDNGSASLTGILTNVLYPTFKLNVDFKYLGKTSTAAVIPKTDDVCGGVLPTTGWVYYPTLNGTLTSSGSASLPNYLVTGRGPAFQLGTGANLYGANNLGASSWVGVYNATTCALTEGDFFMKLNTPVVTGSDFCTNPTANVVGSSNAITITGITSGCAYVQIFNASWASVFNQQTTGTTVTIPNLATGAYKVKVSVLGTGCTWPTVCDKTIDVNVGSTTGNPCDNDVTPPVISGCPGNQIYTTTGTCANTTPLGPITATDNCSIANFDPIVGLKLGDCFPLGLTTVTYTARDAKGNVATCTFTVTVTKQLIDPCLSDLTPPVISGCPANIALTTTGTTAIATWTAPTATDNCGTPTLTSNLASGSAFPIGSNVVTYTATDAKGNKSYCTFYVSVTATTNNNCTVNASAGDGTINFSGLTSGSNIQIFTCAWAPVNVPAYTGSTLKVPVAAGCYIVKYWSLACGEKRFDLTVTTTTVDPCANVTSVKYVANTTDNCGGSPGTKYVFFCSDNGVVSYWTAGTDLRFIEYNNGTAVLKGTIKDGTKTGTLNITFSGKTCTPPDATSPKYELCITSGGQNWCYYTGTNGTFIADGVTYPITRKGPAFQIGNGANLQETTFGASGWWMSSTSMFGDFNLNFGSTVACNGTLLSTVKGQSKLLTLDAIQEGNNVRLDWLNNSGNINQNFEVEKLTIDGNWEMINAVQNKSNTSDFKTYSILDNAPFEGENIYRVKLNFKDGSHLYSAVSFVTFEGVKEFEMYPNPTDESVNVLLGKYDGQSVELFIYDGLGRQVKYAAIDKVTKSAVSLDVNNLNDGHYMVRVHPTKGKDLSKMLIISK